MKELGIIYLTCNRVFTIGYLLNGLKEYNQKSQIDIVIYDSSDGDETRDTVLSFKENNNIKYLFYEKYYGKFDGFSLDNKVIDAYHRFAKEYKYLWICRDGLIIKPDECLDSLQLGFKQEYDMLIVDAAFRAGGHNKEICYSKDDQLKLFEEQACRMVTLGTIILKSSFAQMLINLYSIDDTNYTLWQMVVPFYYYSSHPVNAICILGDVFDYNPAGVKSSFWNSAGKAFDQWVERWYHVISSLPTVYDSGKSKVLKIEMYDFHPFCFTSLIRMRWNGGLSIPLIHKYSDIVPFVSNTKIWVFYFCALVPRFCISWAVGVRHKLKKIKYDLCNS